MENKIMQKSDFFNGLMSSKEVTPISSPSPLNDKWVENTEEAIQFFEKKLSEQAEKYVNLNGEFVKDDEELKCLKHINFQRPRSESELNQKAAEPNETSKFITSSNRTSRPSHLSMPSSLKPILKTSKHKRCSSLGQTLKYIDDTPPSLFTPLTCPSSPNVFNLPSASSCNCSHCSCKIANSPQSVPHTSEDESWIPKNCHYCTYCGCVYDYQNIDTGLTPPLASAEQLSVLDNHGSASNDTPYYGNNENFDRQSLYSVHMEKDFRYYFQHPYARLFIAYFVTFCNFLIFAEDPISHSHTECEIPVVGNVISFICTRYPKEWMWIVIKVGLWVTAIFVGLIVGKYFFHHVLLRRVLRLKMFRDEQGTTLIMLISMFICCYIFSVIYNGLLISFHSNPFPYIINTKMGVTNANFMKAAACGTWLGDFFTAWMVTDMMLQDNLYPGWAKSIRKFWRHHGVVRIVIFWTGSVGMSALVIYLIVSDDISWDNLNQDFIASTELSRAFLASSILVMDLLIVMQDWDFPHFVCDLDIKLPGFKQASYTLKFFRKSINSPDIVLHITGKWFNYGIIVVVMMLDLNMWKNQIIYNPPDYGQYTGPDNKVYSVSDLDLLASGNSSLWTFNRRASTLNPATNKTYAETDLKVNSRYLGYPMLLKSMAFLPCAAGFVLFFTLIYQYGRFPPKTDASHGGRLRKRNVKGSSWRRERRDSRHGSYISWRGITIYGNNAISNLKHSQENSNV
ncbi:uncharacterized protein B4U79_13815 [Dinothrombium tinctorium]|uniref:Uncharacterized protein n=1 Tax=Dinothrombium tinctorium TaxID=1965070 RepID=A0A443QPI3_9ACAR|nr:uncharacterized protein B4U79_13815 [Dinothrombium tinctorium]